MGDWDWTEPEESRSVAVNHSRRLLNPGYGSYLLFACSELRLRTMVSSRTLGGWACVAVFVIVAQYDTLEVTATAEICHAPHDALGGSCMDCGAWMNCFPGESCDTHCSEVC